MRGGDGAGLVGVFERSDALVLEDDLVLGLGGVCLRRVKAHESRMAPPVIGGKAAPRTSGRSYQRILVKQ